MPAVDEKVTDQHTIYVRTGLATQNQLIECVRKCVEEAQKLVPGVDPDFRTNLVKDKNGCYLGYGFVFFKDSRIFDMLFSRKVGGNLNIKPLYEGKQFHALAQLNKVSPILSLSTYQYNEEQLAVLREKNELFQSRGSFEITPAYLRLQDEEFNFRHQLIIINPDPKLQLTTIFKMFEIFSSVPEYPIVRKNKNNIIITFRQGTTDAEFARMLTRKSEIIDRYKNRFTIYVNVYHS